MACDYAEVLVSSVVVAETIVLLIAPRNDHAELAMVAGLNANAVSHGMVTVTMHFLICCCYIVHW